MVTMTRQMDVPSDDLFAELFTKQLGELFGGGGTISDGAQVIRGTISAAFGLHPVVLDGSGLSRDDRSSPADIVDLLRDVWRTPIGRLAVRLAAADRSRRHGQVHRGRDRRPGPLPGQDRHPERRHQSGRLLPDRIGRNLAFALMLDGPSNVASIALEERMVAAIARY